MTMSSPVGPRIADLPASERRRIVGTLTEASAEALLFHWRAWARPNQLPPEAWTWGWLVLAGRGFGKTRMGAEVVREEVEAERAERVAFVGRTVGDVRTVMIEGESGLLACYPRHERNRVAYEPSKRQVQWLAPGQRFVSGREYAGPARQAIGLTFSDDEPDQLRGPQHDFAWVDEPAKFPNAWGPKGASTGELPQEGGTWSNLMLGLRLGLAPRYVATTTPKRTRLIRYLLGPKGGAAVVRTSGSSRDNIENLAPAFVREVLDPYRGTRLERQEILGELIDDVEGALWTWARCEAAHAAHERRLATLGGPALYRKVAVAVDPAVSTGENADETGIMVGARHMAGDRFTVLADLTLHRASPEEWGRRAVDAYHDHEADVIVGEANNGGDMVRAVIHAVDRTVPVELVHASRGKRIRAEPVAARYEKAQVEHAEAFPELVDQLTTWTPEDDESPDRMDALVWLITHLGGVPGKRATPIRAH